MSSRGFGSLPLKIGFVLVIGLSGVFVSIQAGAGTRFALFAGAVGLVVGVVITWFVVRNLRAVMPETPEAAEREW